MYASVTGHSIDVHKLTRSTEDQHQDHGTFDV